MKPSIVYDSTCPVCINYMHKVKDKLGDSIDYLASTTDIDQFQYIDAAGTSYAGTKAIEKMSSDFPAILDYMWMLPQKYKVSGLKTVYKVGSVVRKTIGIVRKGCNCGKNKK